MAMLKYVKREARPKEKRIKREAHPKEKRREKHALIKREVRPSCKPSILSQQGKDGAIWCSQTTVAHGMLIAYNEIDEEIDKHHSLHSCCQRI